MTEKMSFFKIQNLGDKTNNEKMDLILRLIVNSNSVGGRTLLHVAAADGIHFSLSI